MVLRLAEWHREQYSKLIDPFPNGNVCPIWFQWFNLMLNQIQRHANRKTISATFHLNFIGKLKSWSEMMSSSVNHFVISHQDAIFSPNELFTFFPMRNEEEIFFFCWMPVLVSVFLLRRPLCILYKSFLWLPTVI